MTMNVVFVGRELVNGHRVCLREYVCVIIWKVAKETDV